MYVACMCICSTLRAAQDIARHLAVSQLRLTYDTHHRARCVFVHAPGLSGNIAGVHVQEYYLWYCLWFHLVHAIGCTRMTTFISPRLLHFARIYSHSMSLEHCIICQHRSGHITASTLQQCWHAYMLHCIQRPMCRQTPHRRRRLPRPSGISAAAEDRHQWRRTGCGAHTPVARSTSCTVVRRHCSTTPCHPLTLRCCRFR